MSKNCFLPLACALFLWSFLLCSNTIQAQTNPENYIIYNKTKCSIHVEALCTNGTNGSVTLMPDGTLNGTCPVGNYLCFVKIDFPSSNISLAVYVASMCSGLSPSLVSDICYQGYADWAVISSYVTCNIY